MSTKPNNLVPGHSARLMGVALLSIVLFIAAGCGSSAPPAAIEPTAADTTAEQPAAGQPAADQPTTASVLPFLGELPAAIRALVLDDMRLRNDICWFVFDC